MAEAHTGMPALSIRQPWAHLILHGPKRIENRSWGTSYRGPLAIHAPAAWADDVPAEIAAELGLPADLPRSAFVGVAHLAGGHRCPAGQVCSPWAAPGQYHWQLADPRALAEPIPARGRLGLWPTSVEVDRALRALLPQRQESST